MDKREFEEAGYSVRIIEYVSLEKTHELSKSFICIWWGGES